MFLSSRRVGFRRSAIPTERPIKPGQHWKDAAITEAQWEHYPLLPDGTFVPVGALIAAELKTEGATTAVFIEMWGGIVLVGPDLVCIQADNQMQELLNRLREANGGSMAGLPDVIAIFPDGRVSMREAKNVVAKDKLGPKQHAFARSHDNSWAINWILR